MIKEKPILFSGEMVKAILAGTKKQTRRIMKVQPPSDDHKLQTLMSTTSREKRKFEGQHHFVKMDGFTVVNDQNIYFRSPFGYVGEKLWVRETFSTDAITMYPCPKAWYKADEDFDLPTWRHDCPDDSKGNFADCLACWEQSNGKFKWKPSIHMPRKVSRIDLEITNVKIERMQDGGDREFWGEQKWAENHWVWVYEFEVVK